MVRPDYGIAFQLHPVMRLNRIPEAATDTIFKPQSLAPKLGVDRTTTSPVV
jgi:hypothetical protein